MKPLEILSSLPQWAKATPATILTSPAWTLPCRLGDESCALRLDAPVPAETLDILILLGDEEHVLGIVDTPALPELHAVWSARADVPQPILLALVEKECGPLLQLLENAARRQLKIVGLAQERPPAQTAYARVFSAAGDLVSFSITLSPALTETLGQLRFLDASHPSVREIVLNAEVEVASFALGAAEIAGLAPGDALLLPEVDTIPQRLIVDGRFAASGGDVIAWRDEGLLRVLVDETREIALGALIDAAAGNADGLALANLAENTPLRLSRAGAILATGRLGAVGAQRAFVVDAVS
jgi:hypothetical protein